MIDRAPSRSTAIRSAPIPHFTTFLMTSPLGQSINWLAAGDAPHHRARAEVPAAGRASDAAGAAVVGGLGAQIRRRVLAALERLDQQAEGIVRVRRHVRGEARLRKFLLNPASARLLSVYQAPSKISGWSLIENAHHRRQVVDARLLELTPEDV